MKPLAEKMAAAFAKTHSDVSMHIDGGGSSKGIEAAGKGEASVGMASRDLKESEKKAYADLQSFRIAIDGLAIVVHKTNGVKSLTREQIADIYTGKITNWKEVGGADLAILPISSAIGHGTLDAMLEFLELDCAKAGDTDVMISTKGKSPQSCKVKAADGAKATLSQVLANKGAIGYLSAGLAVTTKTRGAALNVVNVNGVEPTEENIHSGKYAWQRSLYLLTKGAPTGDAKAFIDFACGEEGRKIVAEQNYLPPQLAAAPAK